MCYLWSEIWGRRNYLGSEISRSQMCYLWSEIWGRRNYLVSEISRSQMYYLWSEIWGRRDYVGLIRVSLVGGAPMSSMAPLITAVSPHKI